ncbi:MAG TPA: hypothetical protein QF564_05460 [Pirellulaceae bacterium]|jgi:hypothetical protein|nr:hypothetical protein [Pirellulaceae bacterium]
MKRWVPVILLIALWSVVLFILLTPEIPDGHGLQHSRFDEMDQGGNGADRHESLFITGWMFGSLLIASFVSLLLWGTKKQTPWLLFLAGGLIYEGIFGMLCFSYWKSLTDANVAFIGPFPAGVSWLLFGMWLIPAFFIGLYILFYHRWIFPVESARKFVLLAEQRSKT